MESDFEGIKILNDDLNAIFEKELTEESNNSIFMIREDVEIEETPNECLYLQFNLSDQRGSKITRKDSFDYSEYIKTEIKNQGLEQAPEVCRKRIIQKLRNRMSAQRSRLRAKSHQEEIEKENISLKSINCELKQKNAQLESENRCLRERVHHLESSMTAVNSSEEEKSFSDQSEFLSVKRKGLARFPFNRASLFVLLALACVVLFPQNSVVDNPTARLGGLVPMIGSSNLSTGRQLQAVDDICRSYCARHNLLCREGNYEDDGLHQHFQKIKSMAFKPDKEKQIALFNKINTPKLVCFDPAEPQSPDVVAVAKRDERAGDQTYEHGGSVVAEGEEERCRKQRREHDHRIEERGIPRHLQRVGKGEVL